ncbi:MAG: hypothetical protein II927_00570 [Paludibacteraceae bacterium]|nr:hypothetical protein [Paludibacteraceae bacterium]
MLISYLLKMLRWHIPAIQVREVFYHRFVLFEPLNDILTSLWTYPLVISNDYSEFVLIAFVKVASIIRIIRAIPVKATDHVIHFVRLDYCLA